MVGEVSKATGAIFAMSRLSSQWATQKQPANIRSETDSIERAAVAGSMAD
jgi:hypothetical protein